MTDTIKIDVKSKEPIGGKKKKKVFPSVWRIRRLTRTSVRVNYETDFGAGWFVTGGNSRWFNTTGNTAWVAASS